MTARSQVPYLVGGRAASELPTPQQSSAWGAGALGPVAWAWAPSHEARQGMCVCGRGLLSSSQEHPLEVQMARWTPNEPEVRESWRHSRPTSHPQAVGEALLRRSGWSLLRSSSDSGRSSSWPWATPATHAASHTTCDHRSVFPTPTPAVQQSGSGHAWRFAIMLYVGLSEVAAGTHGEDKLWVRVLTSYPAGEGRLCGGPGCLAVCRVPGYVRVSTCVTASPTSPLQLGLCGKGQPAV